VDALKRRALAKAITLLESTKPEHRSQADALLVQLQQHPNPHSKPTLRLGISGVPGVGKSTFIEALGLAMINTLLNDRTDLHMLRMRETVAWGRQRAEEVLSDLSYLMSDDPAQGLLMATKQIGYLVRREAVVMAMSDVFLSLTIIYILLVFLVPFMRSPAPFASHEGGGH